MIRILYPLYSYLSYISASLAERSYYYQLSLLKLYRAKYVLFKLAGYEACSSVRLPATPETFDPEFPDTFQASIQLK